MDFSQLEDDGNVIIPRNFVPAGATPPVQAPAPVAEVPDTPAPAPADTPAPAVPTPTPIVPPTPAPPAGIDPPVETPPLEMTQEMILRGLEVASGGRVKDLDQLRDLMETKEKVPTWTAQIEELKTKAERDPFASPLAKKFNDLLSAGATPDEVSNFMRMQSVDTSKIPALDAVRLAVQSEHPTFDPAMVDAFMADRLGLGNAIEGGELTASDRVALDVAHRDAITKINAQKVASEVPANQAQLADQQAKQQAMRNAFGSVAATIVQANKAIPIGDGLAFNVPSEVLPHAQQFLTDNAMANQWGLDDGGPEKADQMLKSYIWAIYGPQMSDLAVKHAVAKAKQEAVQAQAGAPPVAAPRTVPPNQAPVTNDPNSAAFRQSLML